MVLLAAILLCGIVGLALLLPMPFGIDPNAINVLERLQALSARHWAGTDELDGISACASSGAGVIRS